MALPTNGRVIIETTAGEIEIELWAKETPKTCRNFLALAMEGYYDGVIFHRIVPGFLVQTGDKTGTGGGGESFYGEPFEDEIHPRLRFAHRGLVAMANNGTKNSNDSQFIITLDRAEELHGKHTLFGRCMGDTVYNVMKIGDMETDGNERPLYPPKIKAIRIVDNPFDDIVPRITAAEKRVQQRAREEAQREREEEAQRKGAKKNVKLLSFGMDEDAAEEDEPVVFKKKAIVRPDLMDNPQPAVVVPDFSTIVSVSVSAPKPTAKHEGKPTESLDITKIRANHANEQASSSSARQTEIAKMEADIRKLRKRRGDGDSDDDDEPTVKKPKTSYLEEELAKYANSRGLHAKTKRGRRDESGMLAVLDSFRGKLGKMGALGGDSMDADQDEAGGEEKEQETKLPFDEDSGIEVDDDVGFMSHALHFPKDDGEESRKAERDYEVIDPRERGAKAKAEEKERKRAEKAKSERRKRSKV